MSKRILIYAAVAMLAFLLGAFALKFGRRSSQPTRWQVLLSFQNQDLTKLPDKQTRNIESAINQIIGPQPSNQFPFSPRLFQAMTNTTGRTLYVLVREQPLVTIPGEPRVRVHVFDLAGAQLTSDEFSGGWRTYVTGVSVVSNDLLHQDALTIDGEYWIGGHPSHQYYVLVGDRIVPAYFERDGEFKRDEYLLANAAVAPSIH